MVDWKKVGTRSRRKGTAFEQKVAREISKYTGEKWVRVPYSGAAHLPGDVMCISKPFPVVVELKNRDDVNLDRIFRNPQSIAEYVSPTQILIFNNGGQIVVVDYFNRYEIDIHHLHTLLKVNDEWYMMMNLKDFCTHIQEVYYSGTK